MYVNIYIYIYLYVYIRSNLSKSLEPFWSTSAISQLG